MHCLTDPLYGGIIIGNCRPAGGKGPRQEISFGAGLLERRKVFTQKLLYHLSTTLELGQFVPGSFVFL